MADSIDARDEDFGLSPDHDQSALDKSIRRRASRKPAPLIFPNEALCERCQKVEWAVGLPYVKHFWSRPGDNRYVDSFIVKPGEELSSDIRRPRDDRLIGVITPSQYSLGSFREIVERGPSCPICDLVRRILIDQGFPDGTGSPDDFRMLDAECSIYTATRATRTVGPTKDGTLEVWNLPVFSVLCEQKPGVKMTGFGKNEKDRDAAWEESKHRRTIRYSRSIESELNAEMEEEVEQEVANADYAADIGEHHSIEESQTTFSDSYQPNPIPEKELSTGKEGHHLNKENLRVWAGVLAVGGEEDSLGGTDDGSSTDSSDSFDADDYYYLKEERASWDHEKTLLDMKWGFQLVSAPSNHKPPRAGRFFPARCNLERLKSCLHCCDATHDHSRQDGTRLARLRAPAGFQILLVDTIDKCLRSFLWAELKDHYAALSYVWGVDKQENMLTTANLDTYQAPGRLPNLSRTIEDAICVVKELGLRYLWCDVISIIQDDPEHKAMSISAMGVIFGNAHVTLLAAGSGNCLDGLPGVSCDRAPQSTVTIGDFGFSSIPNQPVGQRQYKTFGEATTTKISRCTWAERAWTLQEYLLSRRLLVFGDQQVIWICPGCHWPEETDSDGTLTQFNDLKGLGIDMALSNYFSEAAQTSSRQQTAKDQRDSESRETMKHYAKLVATYTARKLTLPSDIQNALIGLLDVFFPTGSWWGFPIDHFGACLCWWSTEATVMARRPGFAHEAPSWSWMAWMGTIRPSAWGKQSIEFFRYEDSAKELRHVETGSPFEAVWSKSDTHFLNATSWIHRLPCDLALLDPRRHIVFWARTIRVRAQHVKSTPKHFRKSDIFLNTINKGEAYYSGEMDLNTVSEWLYLQCLQNPHVDLEAAVMNVEKHPDFHDPPNWGVVLWLLSTENGISYLQGRWDVFITGTSTWKTEDRLIVMA